MAAISLVSIMLGRLQHVQAGLEISMVYWASIKYPMPFQVKEVEMTWSFCRVLQPPCW